MSLETVEAIGPFGVGAPEPVVDWGQALHLEPCRAALAVTAPGNEAGLLQYLQVLGNGGLGQCRSLGELDYARFTDRQALQDRSTGGVGESGERPADGILASHHL